MVNTDKWKTASPEVFRLAARLLRMAGDIFSNRGCNSNPEETFENPDDEIELYRVWIQEEDPDDYTPDVVGSMQDYFTAHYLAGLFDLLADNMQDVATPENATTNTTSFAPELRSIYRDAVAKIKAILPDYRPERIKLDIYLNDYDKNDMLVFDGYCEQASDETYIHRSLHGDIVAGRNI